MLRILSSLILVLFVSSSLALDLKGVSRYSNKFELNLATAGVIKAVYVKPGQMVKTGDILVEIDPRAHQARLDSARAIEQSLLPEVNVSEVEFERAQELYDRDSLSQVSLQNAENKLIRAKGQYESAQAKSALMEYELSLTALRAPADGQILAINAPIGRYIDPQVESPVLVSLADPNKMTASAKLQAGQWKDSLLDKKATVKFQGKSYNSQVSSIGLSTIEDSAKDTSYQLMVEFETSTPAREGLPLTIKIK